MVRLQHSPRQLTGIEDDVVPTQPNQAGEEPPKDGQSLAPPRGVGDCVSQMWTISLGTTDADGAVASGGTREEKVRLLHSPRQQSGIESLDVFPTPPKEAGEGPPKVGQTAEPSLGAAGCVSQLWTASGEAREEKVRLLHSPRQQSGIESLDVFPTPPKEAGEGPPKVGQTAEPSLGAAGCVSQLWTASGEAREEKLGPGY
jgi:hypothetical protein